MGRDKALLVLPTGETLLARALSTAKMIANTVMLVAADVRYAETTEVRIVRDVYRGCGPLAGIHAALSASATELNVVLGVDCPLVTPELLRFLVRVAAGTDKLATVPRVAGHLHNVCAVYRKEFANIAEKVLAGNAAPPRQAKDRLAGNPTFTPARANPAQVGEMDIADGKRHGTRIDCLFTETPCRIVEEDELRAAGFGAELFANVNTPEDFTALTLRMQP